MLKRGDVLSPTITARRSAHPQQFAATFLKEVIAAQSFRGAFKGIFSHLRAGICSKYYTPNITKAITIAQMRNHDRHSVYSPWRLSLAKYSSEEPSSELVAPHGRYARMRRAFLREHRTIFCNSLRRSGSAHTCGR